MEEPDGIGVPFWDSTKKKKKGETTHRIANSIWWPSLQTAKNTDKTVAANFKWQMAHNFI